VSHDRDGDGSWRRSYGNHVTGGGLASASLRMSEPNPGRVAGTLIYRSGVPAVRPIR
jgi:hypothetical protein